MTHIQTKSVVLRLPCVDDKSKTSRVDEKSNDDRTPLHCAAWNDHVESCHHFSSQQHEPPYSSLRGLLTCYYGYSTMFAVKA